MTKSIKFTKMHGVGNDYIYVNTMLHPVENPAELAVRWSKPHTGIGSDGLVLIGSSDCADFSMRIFTADGSEAMMCGNASRCIGKYVFERGLTGKTSVRLETLSGIKILNLHVSEDGKTVESVTVDMLEPATHNERQYVEACQGRLTADGRTFEGTFVCMGNPHFVTFVDDAEETDIARYGKILERDASFPERCNIEFATVTADGSIRTRVWERGSGITMACGTGACATAVAAALTGRAARKSIIRMDGGDLSIDWNETDNHVYMTGPAEISFDGEIEI